MDFSMQDGPAPHDALEPEEQRQAERHKPLRAKQIHEIIREEGEAELERDVGPMVWSGLAAGLSMGFSFLTQAVLSAHLPPGPASHLIASFGYTVGFAIVVLGRQQLFTESTLTAVLPVLTHRNLKVAAATAKLWTVVLLANLVGGWMFAAALGVPGLLPEGTEPHLDRLAGKVVEGSFGGTLMRAVFAGWLIALMVWLLPSAKSACLLVIVLLAWVVAAAEVSHIVAGNAEAAWAVLRRSEEHTSELQSH